MNDYEAMRSKFEAKYIPEPNSGCWLWMSSINTSGYGEFWPYGSGKPGCRIPSVRAHRFAYELHRGPIPAGLQLDHICRTRSCVNPDHLEPVTPQENSRRGVVGINHRVKTHCTRGHEYSGDNLYVAGGRRHCRTCRKERAATEQQAKEHCKFGHPWSGDTGPKGRRICYACRDIRGQESN